MASIVVSGDTSGAITLSAPAVAGTNTITFPASTGTIITTASSGKVIPSAALPAGTVLQVVSTLKSDTFTTTSTSFIDITGLSVSITPTSSTNKILVIASVNATGASGAVQAMLQLVRNSTAIDVGDAASTRIQATMNLYTAATDGVVIGTPCFLDSPATTSATTYKVQMRVNSSTGYVNRTTSDTDSTVYSRVTSTITVMEIAA
jgi:hypothetical protein